MGVRISSKHIMDEWSEELTGDGYWIALKSGWSDSSNPQCHTIHADTKVEAHREFVERCYCLDCKTGRC